MIYCLEGLDGSGKTIQADLLNQYINQKTPRDSIITSDFSGTKLGMKVKHHLSFEKGRSSLEQLGLIMMARLALVNDVIKPALKEGFHVVLDRFWVSSAVYQVGLGDGTVTESLFFSILHGSKILDLPLFGIMIDTPPLSCVNRMNATFRGDIAHELKPLEFHIKARESFLKLHNTRIFNSMVVEVGSRRQDELFSHLLVQLSQLGRLP